MILVSFKPPISFSFVSSNFTPMAASKQRLFFFITLLILFHFASSETLEHSHDDSDSDSSLKIKHQHLLAKIHNLESSIEKRSQEINSKDEKIKILETTVVEKSNSLVSLHGEILSLQKKESFDANEQVGEAHERAGELEKQVEDLKKEIARQNSEKELLEARINAAETKIEELNVKLEQLQRINKEQKIRILNTECALQTAEEEKKTVQFRAAHYSKELAEVHESWLPPWLAAHLVHCQSFMVTHWNVYGRPALDVAYQKALETEARFRKWAWPYIDIVHTNGIPIIKERWLTFVTNMEPHAQILTAKTVEIYYESKKSLKAHIVNILAIMDPYIKEAQKLVKPYFDQLSKILEPHLNKARIFMKPYTKKFLRGYRRVFRAFLKHHWRVRGNVREMLKQYEFTRHLATNDLVVWFTASGLIVFPVMVLYSLVSSLFSKKPRRRTNHQRRRAKRVHHDRVNAQR